jgi:predicted secreted protein
MSYVQSAAFAGRGSELLYGSGSPLIYTLLAELKKITFSGRKLDLVDVTNMQSGIFREWLPTLLDSGDVDMDANFIPGDPTQTAINNYFNTATLVPWEVILPNGLGTMNFNGYVSADAWDLVVDKEATVTIKIKITGAITVAFV